MTFLKCLLVLSQRPRFNAFLLQPPTVVGSPTTTFSAPVPDPFAAPSHSGATILSVLCKRKVVAPDTFMTSS